MPDKLMSEAIIIVYLALNPCPIVGHPTMQTQRCIEIIPIVTRSLDDCIKIEQSLGIKIKSRWPQHIRNLYLHGGGSSLSFIPCEEIV